MDFNADIIDQLWYFAIQIRHQFCPAETYFVGDIFGHFYFVA